MSSTQYHLQFVVDEHTLARIHTWMQQEKFVGKSDNVFVKNKFMEILDAAVPKDEKTTVKTTEKLPIPT